MTNEVLGTLTFVTKTENEDSHWLGTKNFAPTGQSIEFILFNDTEGPSEIQTKLLTDIEERYSEFITDTQDLITKNFKDNKFKVGQTIELSFISIPLPQVDNIDFSLTFELTKGFGFLEVEFENWKATWTSFSA